MSTSNYSSTRNVVQLNHKPKVIITRNLVDEIEYLHQQYPNKEWAGSLIYSFVGDLKDYNKMVITCKRLILCGLGDAASAEWDPASHAEYIYEQVPELLDSTDEEMQRGYIHTHHNMGVFFSGTDMAELHDNTKNYPMYLSLIVNNKLEMVAKLCYNGKVTKRTTFSGITRKDIQAEQNYYLDDNVDELLHTMDCAIEFEQEPIVVSEEFKKRFETLHEEKKKKYVSTTSQQSVIGFGKDYPNSWDKGNSADKKEKSFAESTEDWSYISSYIRSAAVTDKIEELGITYETTQSLTRLFTGADKDAKSYAAMGQDMLSVLLRKIGTNIKPKKIRAIVNQYLENMLEEFEDYYLAFFKLENVVDDAHYKAVKFDMMYHMWRFMYYMNSTSASVSIAAVKSSAKEYWYGQMMIYRKQFIKAADLDVETILEAEEVIDGKPN
jgi:predicted DNA-binding protein